MDTIHPGWSKFMIANMILIFDSNPDAPSPLGPLEGDDDEKEKEDENKDEDSEGEDSEDSESSGSFDD